MAPLVLRRIHLHYYWTRHHRRTRVDCVSGDCCDGGRSLRRSDGRDGVKTRRKRYHDGGGDDL